MVSIAIAVPFLGLRHRILYVELVKSKKEQLRL